MLSGPPRKIPDSTALAPPVTWTVMVTEPPAGTTMGNTVHAPSTKELARSAVCGEEPSFTSMVSLLASESQSRA